MMNKDREARQKQEEAEMLQQIKDDIWAIEKAEGVTEDEAAALLPIYQARIAMEASRQGVQIFPVEAICVKDWIHDNKVCVNIIKRGDIVFDEKKNIVVV